MTLLDFARGPALQGALIIFLIGTLWRLVGILALARKPDHSAPRAGAAAQWAGAFGTILNRFLPKPNFWARSRYAFIMGVTFHLGLAIIVFGYAQHIAFIRDLTGLSWPGLPTGIITATSAITIAAMLGMLVRRLTDPVLRLISGVEDYLSWTLTLLPVITGVVAALHWFPEHYTTTLALHILSVCLLLIWMPFGKLAHSFLFIVSRATTGALFARRGAAT